MDKKKKGLILSILAILGLIVITAGVTYSFFSYTKEGTTENTVTTGTITFLYTEIDQVGAGISLTNAFPISDSQGKALIGDNEVFDFKITSNIPSNTSIPYEITARKKIVENMLDEEAVRIYLTKNNGTEEEVMLDNYSNLTQTTKVSEDKYIEKTLHTDKVPADSTNYEQAYRLRMWVDEDVDFSPVKDESGNDTYPYNNKTFTVTVNVYANAKVVTEEEIELESKAEISSLSIDGTELTKVEGQEYDYETTLPEGTTSTTINVETISENATVEVEKIDSLAYSSNIKRLSATKTIDLVDGNNYFKITVTSENKKVENEYKIKISVGNILYTEALLNGADPVLTDNLIPVEISDDGTVLKADLYSNWYDYETKEWANAIVLKDTSVSYDNGDTIPETNIESYFVWIPRYKYKIFNIGSYTGLTSIGSSEQEIEVVFENKDTTVSNGTTVGSYLTHPAFTAFDTNGLWVGKFETGYDGATSRTEAQIDSNDSSKIIIKPNVYSWRNITVGNMFDASYNYLRSNESHMMKNTEWGVVAYLQHSAYGSRGSLRINNNSSYITGYAATEEPTKGYSATSTTGNRYESTTLNADGTYTKRYNSSTGYLASTTGNITGIYDMSGGAWEYVMGYTTGAGSGKDLSGITSLYPNFYSNNTYTKYWDKYTSTVYTNYNYRKLGDATGEMGPFGNQTDPDGNMRSKSSWYGDIAYFVNSAAPWFGRGGLWSHGANVGAFAFNAYAGGTGTHLSFRVVLAPTR